VAAAGAAGTVTGRLCVLMAAIMTPYGVECKFGLISAISANPAGSLAAPA